MLRFHHYPLDLPCFSSGSISHLLTWTSLTPAWVWALTPTRFLCHHLCPVTPEGGAGSAWAAKIADNWERSQAITWRPAAHVVWKEECVCVCVCWCLRMTTPIACRDMWMNESEGLPWLNAASLVFRQFRNWGIHRLQRHMPSSSSSSALSEQHFLKISLKYVDNFWSNFAKTQTMALT